MAITYSTVTPGTPIEVTEPLRQPRHRYTLRGSPCSKELCLFSLVGGAGQQKIKCCIVVCSVVVAVLVPEYETDKVGETSSFIGSTSVGERNKLSSATEVRWKGKPVRPLDSLERVPGGGSQVSVLHAAILTLPKNGKKVSFCHQTISP